MIVPACNAIKIHVPMDRWCVTRQDLLQFKRLVWHAIKSGRIAPTELDPFDPKDNDVLVWAGLHPGFLSSGPNIPRQSGLVVPVLL